jgi:hypothetical protein
MMRPHTKLFAGAALALFLASSASNAATIIKLDLGGTGPDVFYSGGVFGTLSTVDDGDDATTGQQNTAILYTSFLSTTPATNGSYTLSGVTATGAPVDDGGVVSQNFAGGNFQLYNAANALLLDVNLSTSRLTGADEGAFFSITKGTVVGGFPPLISQLVSNSIGLSMSLTDITGGGLSIGGTFENPLLNSFFADATKEITAAQVPEPGTAILVVLCGLVVLLRKRRN